MGAFKKSRGKVILIAQELELARELASNNKATRDKALRKLRKWFTSRSQGIHKFEKDDFLRIWKGLFYCMWMSDKPLVQEDLAQEISNLVHSLVTVNAALKFIQAGFSALSIEWFGIDDLRINKFMMLVRRIVRQSFTYVQKQSWKEEDVKALADMYHSVLTDTNSLGLKFHLIEIYCEELAKIGGDDLPPATVLSLVTPFGKYMASTKDGRLISHITRHVFLHLIHQSEAGIEFEEKFNAWKQLGFPGGTIDALQRADPEESGGEDGEDGEEPKQKELDPRAGRVNVELPMLIFDPKDFVSMFTTLKISQETTVKARKTVVNLIQKFEKLSKGEFPLGIHKVELPEKVPLKKEILHFSEKLFKKRSSKSMADEEYESVETEPKQTPIPSHKSKKPVAKLKWNVTEIVNKDEELGKENIASSKKTDSWEIQPSAKKRKSTENESKGTPQTKQQKVVGTPKFQISDAKEKSAVKVKSIKSGVGIDLNKVKVKKLKQNGIGSKNVSLTEESSESVNKSLKKNKAAKRESLKHSFTFAETNDWGKEWETGLREGETEIFVPNKKYLKKLSQNGGTSAAELFLRRRLGESKDKIMNPFALSPGNKKVEFALGLNTSQEHKEYRRSLKRASDIVPFDALNQPKKGVLKSTPVNSPINPFFQIDRS